LKGAGASFGIVTEFKIRTQPAPGESVRYEYTFDSKDPASRAETFNTWQKFVADHSLPRELNTMLDVFPHKIIVSGTYFGSKAKFDALKLDSLFSGN